ncbi:oligosaccharide flippase family protein [Stappia taiwanensis]|uniref:Oligosaccharide flippase family protein n=1 Tax=Stappia taiwanensis TaxID=992267 RepID=A0A838XXY4_9HYPH|nr:oligosaccharide flippase family protein [Stappia taiwanensis]MBA4611753.1 oligosaccharide flippase family protein [Stappia taiwanensis]GGE97067.1 polysaccharide biosynthesis protein [Stappia taiwanensis]
MKGADWRKWPVMRALSRIRVSALVGGGAWTLCSKLVSQALQLAMFIVAAHILVPAEFGFYAFASAFAVILVVFSECGWREFLLKSAKCEQRKNEVATMSAVSALLFTLVALVAAWGVAHVLGRVWEAWLIALYSLWIMPAALSGVYEGVLISRGQLRRQAQIRLLAEGCGFLFAIGGLWNGWGAYALVAGRLVMQGVYLLGAAVTVRWWFIPRFDRGFTAELLEYSRHILLLRVMLQMRSYAGTLAIGSFLGLTDAGFYRAAERIVAAVSELIAEPARLLAWTLFRKAGGRSAGEEEPPAALGVMATRFMLILMAVSLPVYFGLALVAERFVPFLLGDKWQPAAVLVVVLSFKQVFLVPSFVTEPLLSIAGTIRKAPGVALFNGCVSIVMIVLCAPFGVLAAALGQIVAALIALGTSMYLQGRYGGLHLRPAIMGCGSIFVACVPMAIGVSVIGYLADGAAMAPVWGLVLQVLGGAVIYPVVLYLLRKTAIEAPLPATVLKDGGVTGAKA